MPEAIAWFLVAGGLMVLVGLTDTWRRELPFSAAAIYLVAGHLLGPYLNNFAQKYNLRDHPQIWMGMDYDNLIDKAFLYYALPQLCVYDKDKKLVKMFSGGAPIDTLKQYLH